MNGRSIGFAYVVYFAAVAAVLGAAFVAVHLFTKPPRFAALEPLPAFRWELPGENR